MTKLLFYCEQADPDMWRDAFQKKAPELDFRNFPDWGTPEDGDAIAYVWHPEPGLLARYPNIKAIFSLGAGIDHLTCDPELPRTTPIIRMGDDGLKEGMVEYMTMGVLMLHRGMLDVMARRNARQWQQFFAPAADRKTVGILGYGTLGRACADALKPLGYKLTSWSRSEKPEEAQITHYHGNDGFDAFLAATDYFVCLLPNTPETTDLLNRETFAKMPKGAGIINGGRGNLIAEDDLIEALDSGHLSAAILDVFKTEPLPEDHPFWTHDRIFITPHIAAVTRVRSAVDYVVRNWQRLEQGQTPENLLDLNRGY